MHDPKRNFPSIGILAILVFLVFGNTFFHQFTYDDHKGIEGNRYIESLRNFPLLFSGSYFDSFTERSYRPVVTASYFIDHLVWGKNAFGYHLTNLLLHLATVIFFYVFSRYIFKEEKARLFAAILFALHPAVCEPVNSISFREDILAGLFVMITLVFLLSNRARSPLYLAGSVLSGCLALLSKESAIPLFFICCLLIFMGTGKKEDSKKIAPIPLLLSQSLVLVLYLIIRFKIMANPEVWQTRLLGESAAAASAHAGFLFFKVWQTLLFPFHLNADYVFPYIKGIFTPYSILGALFLLLYLFLVLFLYKKGYKRLFIGFSWILLFFIPSSNLVPLTNPFAERYLYLMLPGFAILAASGYDFINNKMKGKSPQREKLFLYILPSLLFLVLAALSVNRNLVWSTDITLWNATLKREPESIRALNGVGLVFFQEGENEPATELFRKALAIDPLDYEIRNNLAVVYIHDQKPELAKQELEIAVNLNPGYAPAHYNLGRLYLSEAEKDLEKVRFHLNRARELGYPVPDSLLHK